MAKKESTSALAKEWFLLVAGLAGMGFQLWTNHINIWFLLACMSLTGTPGFAHIVSLIKNSPIVLQSSSSRPDLQESGSDNSSRNSLGGEE